MIPPIEIRVTVALELPDRLELLLTAWAASVAPKVAPPAESTFIRPASPATPPAAVIPAPAERQASAPIAPPPAPHITSSPRPAHSTLPPEPPKRWTAERNAVIEREYPRDTPLAEILAQLNALPGPTIAMERISIQAAYLKARRPGYVPPKRAVSLDTTAADIERSLVRDANPTVDWPAALQWARENKIEVGSATSPGIATRKINAARKLFGLPPWIIVQPRGRIDPLPAAQFGRRA